MANLSNEYKEKLLNQLDLNLMQTPHSFINVLENANKKEALQQLITYKKMSSPMPLDYILPYAGIISLVLIGTIIFYKFNFWEQIKAAISSYWNDGASIGGILEDGFKACGHGIYYTKDFLQCFIKYITLNRETLIAVRQITEILNEDGKIHVGLFKQIINLATQNEILFKSLTDNQSVLKHQILVLQTDLTRVMEIINSFT